MTNRRLVCTLLIYSYVLLHLSVTPTHTRLLTSDMFLQRHHNTQCSQPEVSLTLHSKLACAAACRLHLCDVMCGRKLTGGLWLCVLCKSPTTFMAPDASQTDYMVYLINSQTGISDIQTTGALTTISEITTPYPTTTEILITTKVNTPYATTRDILTSTKMTTKSEITTPETTISNITTTSELTTETTTSQTTTSEITTPDITTKEITISQVTTPEITTTEITTSQVTTPEITTTEITTSQVTTLEITTTEITTSQVTTPEITTLKSSTETTTPQTTTSDITTPEITTPQVTTSEITTSEVTTTEGSITVSCSSCLHGGTCLQSTHDSSVSCVCTPRYSGAQCEDFTGCGSMVDPVAISQIAHDNVKVLVQAGNAYPEVIQFYSVDTSGVETLVGNLASGSITSFHMMSGSLVIGRSSVDNSIVTDQEGDCENTVYDMDGSSNYKLYYRITP